MNVRPVLFQNFYCILGLAVARLCGLTFVGPMTDSNTFSNHPYKLRSMQAALRGERLIGANEDGTEINSLTLGPTASRSGEGAGYLSSPIVATDA